MEETLSVDFCGRPTGRHCHIGGNAGHGDCVRRDLVREAGTQ